MLRMAHRVLTQRFQSIADEETQKRLQDDTWRPAIIGGLPVIIADNIHEYRRGLKSDDWLKSLKSLACKLPFKAFLVEWAIRATDKDGELSQVGMFVWRTDPKKDGITFQSDDIEEVAKMQMIYTERSTQQIFMLPYMLMVGLRKDGTLCMEEYYEFSAPEMAKNEELCHELLLATQAAAGTVLFTIGLLNCNNVTQLDVTRQEGPPPGWCKRKRVPALKYHVIQIDPNVGTRKRAGERKTEGDRSGKALHICRGHFMHCVNGGVSNGLFGKGIYGTFWVPSHVRGLADLGRVIPTYNVLAPSMEKHSRPARGVLPGTPQRALKANEQMIYGHR